MSMRKTCACRMHECIDQQATSHPLASPGKESDLQPSGLLHPARQLFSARSGLEHDSHRQSPSPVRTRERERKLTRLAVQCIQRRAAPLRQDPLQKHLNSLELVKVERLLVALEINGDLAQLCILVLVDEREIRCEDRRPRVGIALGCKRDTGRQVAFGRENRSGCLLGEDETKKRQTRPDSIPQSGPIRLVVLGVLNDPSQTLHHDSVLGRQRIPSLLQPKDRRAVQTSQDGKHGGKIVEQEAFLFISSSLISSHKRLTSASLM